MTLKSSVSRIAICAVILLSLSANKGCEKQGVRTAYVVESVPEKYRQCFAGMGIKIKDYETNGVIAWKDAQRLIADLKADNNGLRRCGAGAIAWVDVRDAALNRYLGK